MKIYIQFQRCLFLPACLLAAGLLAVNTASAQRPTITSFSPSSGAPGSSITITGTNFNSTLGSNIVFVGGIRATVTSASITSLTVTVPRGASYGPITAMNTANSLLAYSSQYFLPTITGPTKQLLIKADLTYQSTYTVPIGGQPTRIRSLVAGDLTGDGIPDLILSNHGVKVNPATNVIRNTIVTSGTISTVTLTNVTFSGYDGQGRPEMGDMDGDGDLDVVSIANVYNAAGTIVLSSDVFLLRNSGAGVFTSVGPFAISAGGAMAAIADIDGDGKSDIASFNYQSTNISILLNTSAGGTIGFSPTVNLASTSRPLFGMLVDLDGDNKPDIIQSNRSTGTGIGIRLNTSSVGSVSFSPTTTVNPSGANEVAQVAAGDLDGDGKLDLVLAVDGSGENSVVVLRNTSTPGNLSFGTPYYINIGFSQSSIALGDLNGDGRAELLVNPDNTTYETFVFANTSAIGNISFNTAEQFTTSTGGGNAMNFAEGLVIADFNNDGITDVLSAVTNQVRINIYRGSPQFAPTISSFTPLSQVPGSNIAITGTGFNSTHGNNTVMFGGVKATTVSGNTTTLTVRVPDNAQYAPITVLNTGNTLSASSPLNFIPVFTPNKTAIAVTDFVQQSNISITGEMYGMAAGDLTGDGKPELVISNNNLDQITIMPNSSGVGAAVSFSPSVILSPGSAVLDGPRYIALGDLDGNGWIDMAVPSSQLDAVVVFLNNGSGVVSTAFTVSGSFATGNTPNGIAIGDVDGDGKPDIVTSNIFGFSVSVLRNISGATGAISFAPKQDFNIAGTDAIYNVALIDIDNDGKLDIVSGRDINSNPGKVVLLRNVCEAGVISFTGVSEMDGPYVPWTPVPADLNADGLNDLVVSSGSGSPSDKRISVYTKISNGGSMTNFSRTDLPVLQESIAVGVADLSGDAKPDIVTATRTAVSSNYTTHIFPNTTAGTSLSFATRVDLVSSTSSRLHTVVTDMNSDGKPDILEGSLAPLGGGYHISIYRNQLIATPVTQASNILITTTGTGATLTWTNGSGTERAVFLKQDNAGNAAPLNNTPYTANTVFTSGTQIDATGWYCVYNGTGNSVTVSGLTPGTTYRAMVVEYNDGGLTNTAQYNTNTASNNPVNFTTRATITAISRTTASATINTNTATFNVTFNAPVTVLSPTNHFSLSLTGSIAGALVTAVNGSGTSFTVTVNTGSGDGTLRLNLSSQAGMVPGVTNTLPFAGETYTIDKTAPTLTPIAIVSNNSNTSRAKPGDLITLSFTASETIATPTVTIAGQTATVTNTGGDNWTAVYTMTGTDPEGTISFNISFSDIVGNAGTAVTATTNSSSVIFDRTAPTLSPVTIASDNSNTSLAKTGNTVTLSFTSSETIVTPSVTILGNSITPTNTGGDNWTASCTLASGNTDGAVSFSIGFVDLYGNAGTTVSSTTNSSAVVFDKTAPLLSAAVIASGNGTASRAKPGDMVTVNFTATEPLLTPAVTIAGNTATVTNTSADHWTASYTMGSGDAEGTVSFTIAFSDITGNSGATVTATTNSSTVVFDRTRPTLSNVAITSNNSNTAKAKPGDIITLGFSSGEAISAPAVTIAGHAATVTNTSANNWTAVYTMVNGDTEGPVSFNIVFSDVTGNAGTAVAATSNSSSVAFDRTIPTLSNVAIASNNSNTAKAKSGDIITLGFSSDEAISAPAVTIAGHTATVTNTSANNWTAVYTMVNGDTEGPVSFNIVFSDVTGNAGTAVTTTSNSSSVVFDKTVPALNNVSIASNNSNTTKAKVGDLVTLGFTSSENIATPSVTIAGHTATVTNTSGNNWTASYTMTNGDTEGMVSFSINFSDLTGNAGTVITTTSNSSSVVFDKTVPALTNVSIASNNSNATKAKVGDLVTLGFTSSENIATPSVTIAGHTATVTNTSGNNWTAVYTMVNGDTEGSVSFNIVFSDITGNAGTAVTATSNSSTVVFDKTVPTLSNTIIVSNNSNNSWARTGDKITLSFTANEILLTPTLVLAGHSITPVVTAGNAWAASYTMTVTDTEGQVPFSIAFTDLAGNNAISVTGTTDNSNVVFDRTVPVINPVSIISNNTLTQTALIGNTVTISFVLSEGVLTPTVQIAGHAVPAANTIGNTWTASYVMQATDAGGPVAFSITAADRAGNTSGATTTSTDNTSVSFLRSGTPVFTNGITQNLVICEGVSTDIGNLLKVTHTIAGEQITITVAGTPSNGTLTGFNASLMSNGNIVTPSGLFFTPAAGFTGADAFTIQVTNGLVTSTSTIHVTVNAKPAAASISGSAILCEGLSTTLSTNGGSLYTWFKDGSMINGITTSQLIVTSPGSYSAVITNAAGCEIPASNSITVGLIQKPKADFNTGALNCIGKSVVAANTSVVAASGTVSYLWSDGNGGTSASVSPSFIYTQTGNYSIKLKVIPQSCPAIADSIIKTVSISEPVTGTRNPAVDIVLNEATQLQVRTLPGVTYQWSPGRFLQQTAIPNPMITASAEQEYEIRLTTASGCVTVDTLLVRVHQPRSVYLPNVFTPNGDGRNDVLKPIMVGIKQMRWFRVYNRMGRLVFETTNMSQGWDGRYNGALQPMDTYTWSIEGIGDDNSMVKRQGSVSLLR